MVSLKYIENPFTDDYLFSFECFRNEKKFYDCIGRKVINNDDVFENLGSSFYTYLLIGDNDEWIGYILFHNDDLIKRYIDVVEVELRKLLLGLKWKIRNKKIIEKINILFKELNNRKFSDTVNLNSLKESIELLNILCINEDSKNSIYFSEYYSNIFTYLYSFEEYYYLDIVIGLPLNVKTNEIESKYYGFIREAYHNVEELIKEEFNDIPIVLKNVNSMLYLLNNCEQKVKLLEKKDITKF